MRFSGWTGWTQLNWPKRFEVMQLLLLLLLCLQLPRLGHTEFVCYKIQLRDYILLLRRTWTQGWNDWSVLTSACCSWRWVQPFIPPSISFQWGWYLKILTDSSFSQLNPSDTLRENLRSLSVGSAKQLLASSRTLRQIMAPLIYSMTTRFVFLLLFWINIILFRCARVWRAFPTGQHTPSYT